MTIGLTLISFAHELWRFEMLVCSPILSIEVDVFKLNFLWNRPQVNGYTIEAFGQTARSADVTSLCKWAHAINVGSFALYILKKFEQTNLSSTINFLIFSRPIAGI